MDQFISQLKSFEFYNNTGFDYALAIFIIIISLVVLKIFQTIVLSKLNKFAKKTKTKLDDTVISIFKSINPPFYFFVAFYFGVKALILPEIVNKVIGVVITIWVVYEVMKAVQRIIDFFVKAYVNKVEDGNETKKQSKAMIHAFSLILKIVLWALGVTLVLGNLGIDITSLVAGLGVGGIAIALAAQNVLADLFSAFSIYLDKPFVIGDFVTIGKDSGTIEKIGLKTTRLRTVQGEELVISNKELTSTRIQNFRKLEKRRDSFVLGVTYETSREKLIKIPSIIEAVLVKYELAEFLRCGFKAFGPSSLDFEIVYNVKSSDYDEFAQTKYQINLDIIEVFEKEKIDFAYPTQTIYKK